MYSANVKVDCTDCGCPFFTTGFSSKSTNHAKEMAHKKRSKLCVKCLCKPGIMKRSP